MSRAQNPAVDHSEDLAVTWECGRCHLSCRTPDGLCTHCLLEIGISQNVPDPSEDTFEALFQAADMAVAGRALGNYEILAEIGQGGMGRIFRARQRHSGRVVALKRLLACHADSPALVSRFRREAEAVASLDHPNVLPIYEVGEDEHKLPFFSMKLASGGNLLQARSARRYSPREAVRLLAKVARAIHHAHGVGLLHRDLKPANILLNEQGEPLVADFGLAKWLDDTSDLTRTLTFFGTPGYVAPEQAHGPSERLTPATDVYALGAILFELLAGRPPFTGHNALTVVRQAAEQSAPRLRSLVPALDRDLETLCAHCLEREPSARYQSASELADDLERWLDRRPLVARPVPITTRLWRWARRNPLVASTAFLCVMLLGALGFRQWEGKRLRAVLDEKSRAQHSVAILPFLNLDQGTPDVAFGAGLSKALETGFERCGPAVVYPPAQPSADWTGIGAQDEIRSVARQFNVQAVLSGTVRRRAGRLRVSLRLTRQDGTSVLGCWIAEADAGTPPEQVLARLHILHAFYALLAAPADQAVDLTKRDPANRNPLAQTYLNTGRNLMDRHTPADMDRARSCFEEAIQAEPQTVVARSYLASAYLGRYLLGGDRSSVERAFAVARDALRLSPEDPSANGALCNLDITIGRYADALEAGFRSLEYGDFTERSLGRIAYTWKALGHPEQAILWFEKAQVSARQRADYDALLGDCWMELCDDQRAVAAYDAATRSRPDLADGWAGRCHLALLQADFDRARQLFREHAEEYRASPASRQVEAQLELFARDRPKAKQIYEELLNTTGGHTTAFYGGIDFCTTVGWLQCQAGEAAGRSTLEQARTDLATRGLNPQTPEALYRAAALHAALGETEPAIARLRDAAEAGWLDYRSLKLDPRFDSLRSDTRLAEIQEAMVARVSSLRQQITREQSR